MHSLTDEFLDRIRFTADHAAVMKAIGECRGKQALFARQTPEVLAALRHTAIIESAESSNRLEGITAPPKRVAAIVLKPTAAKNRSEQEIAGYRDALTLIHDAAEHVYLSTAFICQLHRLLYRYLPTPGGTWKTVDNEIVERDPDSGVVQVRFTPTSAAETPAAMERLVERATVALDKRQREPLIVVPLVILDFLCIHPFLDGNGRVGRLLTLLLLYRYGYEVGRYISLERVVEQSRETYYEALEASSRGWHAGAHDPFPWLTYFWGALLRAYREFEERVGTLRHAGRGAKTARIHAAVQRMPGPFSISDIEFECRHISHDMVRHVLRQLRDEGVIVPRGRGRGAHWLRVKDVPGEGGDGG